MIIRGWRSNLWRSRLPSAVTSHRNLRNKQSHFSVFHHASETTKIPVNLSSPLSSHEDIIRKNPQSIPTSDSNKSNGPECNSNTFSHFGPSPHLRISDEVRAALAANKPVVALESTIYTHGLPYPDNADLAVHLEQKLRDMGVIPATIGLVDGVAVIGMNPLELHTLASAAGRPETMKISRRDLPYIIGMGLTGKKIHGGTTVAATMYLAEMCGIKVFATGGIGGVHRGGQDSLDISADLNELGRTSMAVIASGCKSFLDIPRTLEYLETQGVTVATFSKTGEKDIPFPAFYTADSGVKSPMVVKSANEVAAIIYAQELLGSSFRSGFFLGNPIPEESAMSKAYIDSVIEEATQEATSKGISGHKNTPFILSRIKDLTEGKSVVANKALIESNVILAGRIARSLTNLRLIQDPLAKEQNSIKPPKIPNAPVLKTKNPPNKIIASGNEAGLTLPDVDVMVFGSLAVDLSCDYSPETKTGSEGSSNPGLAAQVSPVMHTSNIATINTTLGGVGHNVALAAHRATAGNLNVRLCSYVADDFAGTTALNVLQREGLDTRGVRVKPAIEELANDEKRSNHTAQYVAVNDKNKDLVLAMADMSIFDNRGYRIEPGHNHWKQINAAKWTVIDANWEPRVIHIIARAAARRGSKVIFEPVSTHKSTRLLNIRFQEATVSNIFPWNLVDLSSPNQYELAAMHSAAKENGLMEKEQWWKAVDAMGIPSSGARDRFVQLTNAKMADEGIPVQAIQLLPFIPIILTKLGSAGILHTELLKPDDPRLTDPLSAPYILSRCANGTTEVGGVYMRLFPAAEVVKNVVSVNGVGDTFLGVLVAGLASGLRLDEELINTAQQGAVLTLRSKQAVSPELKGLISSKSQDQELADQTEGLLNYLDM